MIPFEVKICIAMVVAIICIFTTKKTIELGKEIDEIAESGFFLRKKRGIGKLAKYRTTKRKLKNMLYYSFMLFLLTLLIILFPW